MNKKRSMIISIIIVVLIILLVFGGTFAFMTATTGERNVNTGSSMLGINYDAPDNITGNLISSSDRSSGLLATATASLQDESEVAIFNMYIIPTALTNLNIPALKWEAEGLRDGKVICSGSGDFSEATVDEPIKLFVNDTTDDIDDCFLSTTDTTFNIYVWLDISLINSPVSGASFGAKISADSVQITGRF